MSFDVTFRFELSLPTKVIFGESRFDEIGRHIDFAQRILVITSKRISDDKIMTERLAKALKGKDFFLYTGVTRNPKASEVNEAASLGRKKSVEAVLGIGGGSVLDAAKGAAVAIGSENPIEYFLQYDVQAPRETLPIITIPTTAGTGSEVSRGAILTDTQRRVKKGLRGEFLHPRLAVLDPCLTYTMPREITAETGFDILTHAIETYVSKKATPFTEMLSLKAVEIVKNYLPRAFTNSSDFEARRYLMFASMLMGINLSNSTTCLPHRLQYPVGARTDTSHPRGLAALYRSWCEHTYEHAIEKFAILAEHISENSLTGKSKKEKAKSLGFLIDDFGTRLGVKHRLRDFGIPFDVCKDLVDEVEGDLTMDPGFKSRESLRVIYEQSW